MPDLRRLDPADWPGFAAGFRDLTYEQSLAWAAASAARLGAEVQVLGLERDGRPVAGAVARVKRVPGLGRGIAWIASGPVALAPDAPDPSDEDMTAILAALRAELRDRQGHVLRLRPPVPHRRAPGSWEAVAAAAGFAPSARARGYRTVLLDLRRDDAALMRGLDGKWRTELRAALRAGLAVDRGPAAEADRARRFRALYDRVREAKGFESDLEPEFFLGLAGPDFRAEVLIATKDGVDVAGVTVGETGPVAVYLHGATDEAGRRLRAGYLLTWEALRAARDRGRAWYDLGGIDPEANPGVTRFKLRMGGEDLTAPGPWEARPPGPLPRLIEGLEALRARARGWRR